ncbi:uncharacterized protein LOC126265814 [Aethina tumida]|uniref:uncharacterized protein LOC126265814 n=1 Tax=Aethina tumida TaxID=116153 RepID=UPI0021494620|nr:uncharacterized protein LOC126265814 [Aethina tumida]
MFQPIVVVGVLLLATQSQCITTVFQTNDPRANLEYQNGCQSDTGVTQEQITALEHDGEVTEDINCYFKCIFMRSGLFDENGIIQVENIRSNPFMDNIDFDCLQNLNAINECNDMNQLYNCNI